MHARTSLARQACGLCSTSSTSSSTRRSSPSQHLHPDGFDCTSGYELNATSQGGRTSMQHVSLRRRWRERPDPIAGMRPLVFYVDDLQVSTVHVYYAGSAALRCSTIRMKSRAVGSEASSRS